MDNNNNKCQLNSLEFVVDQQIDKQAKLEFNYKQQHQKKSLRQRYGLAQNHQQQASLEWLATTTSPQTLGSSIFQDQTTNGTILDLIIPRYQEETTNMHQKTITNHNHQSRATSTSPPNSQLVGQAADQSASRLSKTFTDFSIDAIMGLTRNLRMSQINNGDQTKNQNNVIGIQSENNYHNNNTSNYHANSYPQSSSGHSQASSMLTCCCSPSSSSSSPSSSTSSSSSSSTCSSSQFNSLNSACGSPDNRHHTLHRLLSGSYQQQQSSIETSLDLTKKNKLDNIDNNQDKHTSSKTSSGKVKRIRAKKYKCPYCWVALSNSGQFKGHLRTHTGERPFQCDQDDCGKRFTRNEELTRHKRIHSGLKPFLCDQCQKGFGRRDHLKKHLKTHINRRQHQPSPEKTTTLSNTLIINEYLSIDE